MCKLKQKLMAGIVAGTIALNATPSMAAGWASLGVSAVGATVGQALSFWTATNIIYTFPGLNVDPVQLGLEVGELAAMKKVKYEWKPKPQKEYQEAAGSNGGGSGGGGGDINGSDSLVKTLGFQVGSLQNVGIEAIDVGPDLSDVISADTRNKILSELETFQAATGSQSNSSSNNSSSGNQQTGAGSCSAPYTICEADVTTTQKGEISTRQEKNQQWFGTAGIAHAELGMKSVYQAIVNDGGGIDAAGASASQDEIKAAMASAQAVKVQDLTGLIGIAQNTVMAQKIVALMNLELAQRLNQGNMLQGSILTIEAARALRATGNLQH